MLLYRGTFRVKDNSATLKESAVELTDDQLDELAVQIEEAFDALVRLIEEKYPGVKADWE